MFHLIVGRKRKADDAQIRHHYILQQSIKQMLFLAICYKPLKKVELGFLCQVSHLAESYK